MFILNQIYFQNTIISIRVFNPKSTKHIEWKTIIYQAISRKELGEPAFFSWAKCHRWKSYVNVQYIARHRPHTYTDEFPHQRWIVSGDTNENVYGIWFFCGKIVSYESHCISWISQQTTLLLTMLKSQLQMTYARIFYASNKLNYTRYDKSIANANFIYKLSLHETFVRFASGSKKVRDW